MLSQYWGFFFNLRILARGGSKTESNRLQAVKEIEKFVIRQPPIGEQDDYDGENSWISDGLPSSSSKTERKHLVCFSFYCLQYFFHEYLRISQDIQYPNGQIGWESKKEVCQGSMYWLCYPRISGKWSEFIKKVPMMERLPWRMNTIEH